MKTASKNFEMNVNPEEEPMPTVNTKAKSKIESMEAHRIVWRITRSEMFPFASNPVVATLFMAADPIELKGGDFRPDDFRSDSAFETQVSNHLRRAKNSAVLTLGNNTMVTMTSVDGSNMQAVTVRSPKIS